VARHGWAGKGSSRRWRTLRLSILARDKWTCQLQLAGCTHDATDVHHTMGKDAGDDPRTLLASCQSCNTKIGDPLKFNPEMRSKTRW